LGCRCVCCSVIFFNVCGIFERNWIWSRCLIINICFGDPIIKSGFDPIYRFNTATCLCLSEAKNWIYLGICPVFLCSVISGGIWLFTLLILVTLLTITIKLSFHNLYLSSITYSNTQRGHRGRDRMVVGCTTTYAISAYHY